MWGEVSRKHFSNAASIFRGAHGPEEGAPMPLSPGVSLATGRTCRTVPGLSPAGGGWGWLWQGCSNQGLCLPPQGAGGNVVAPPGTGLSLPGREGWHTGRMAWEGRGALQPLYQTPRAAHREAGGGKFLLSSPCPHFEGRESCGNPRITRRGAHLAPQLRKDVRVLGKEPKLHAHLCSP